nr:MAG TPA: hypothetical protein [Caudoviricetes sp.]
MLFQELLLSYDSLKGLIFVCFVDFFYGKDITSSVVPLPRRRNHKTVRKDCKLQVSKHAMLRRLCTVFTRNPCSSIITIPEQNEQNEHFIKKFNFFSKTAQLSF